MNYVLKFLAIVIALSFTACTQQTCARSYGGHETVHIPCGEKIVDVTWKGSSRWVATAPMTDSDIPRTIKYREDSSWNMVEGSVTFIESKCE